MASGSGKYMGIGIAVGIAIGAAVGVALNNIPVWTGLGVAIGVAIGFGLAKNNQVNHNSFPLYQQRSSIMKDLSKLQKG